MTRVYKLDSAIIRQNLYLEEASSRYTVEFLELPSLRIVAGRNDGSSHIVFV